MTRADLQETQKRGYCTEYAGNSKGGVTAQNNDNKPRLNKQTQTCNN